MIRGIKISKDKNVFSAEEKDLSLSGIFKIFKIKKQGVENIPSNTTKDISHGFGYRPNFLAYMADEFDSSVMRLVTASVTYSSARAWVDTYNFYLRNIGGTARDSFYYLFTNPIEK